MNALVKPLIVRGVESDAFMTFTVAVSFGLTLLGALARACVDRAHRKVRARA